MFFSTYVLTKKGPLAKIWLAAHWERRLTRNEVRVVDLRQSVVDIVQPVVPIALRTSGELLVGVVRIYALKVKHLLKDASDATLLLRVTTLPTKSAPESATTGKKDSNVSVDGVLDRSARALLDGVLLSGKGDIEAVTFDWAGGNGASGIVVTGSSGKADAEALEARFDDIADLLHGSKDEAGDGGLGSMSSGDMNAFLTSAWYSMEPSSYATEEVHNTQQDYDEIAKLRADLLAFGDHGEGSSNSRKSSLSSIEKARSSGVAGAAVMDAVPMGDFLAFPQPNDAIDIGAPLHGEQMLLPDFMIPSSGEAMDPFLLPSDALGAQTQQEDEDKLRIRQRKSRLIANAVDHGETTLSGDVIRRWMENHGDIVDAVPRHGPCDAQEVRDRSTLTQDSGNGEHWAAMDGSLLSGVPNPSLAALYRTTLTPLIEVAEAAMRPIPPPKPEEEEHYGFVGGATDGMMGETHDAHYDENVIGLASDAYKREGGVFDDVIEDSGPHSGGLSATALATLKRIQEKLASVEEQPTRRGKKGAKKAPSVSPREKCSMQELCRGMNRREAARAFVSVLTLASKQLVWAKQGAPDDDVELGLLEDAHSILLSA